MSARWELVQKLFHEADELPAERRAGYLTQVCGDDTELSGEVEALLRASEDADGFLQDTVQEAAVDVLDKPRHRIGVYQVERPLGHGGMGSVYLAVRADDEYRKRVAIKMVRGGNEAPEMLRRFRAERQILADLNHPGIAQLLDGAVTEAGSPYLVMEYVEGLPADEYCRAKRLSIAARLRLFQQVCEAVTYAHRHLVVHCDLKPNNILVTEEGLAKLLDFGTAKLFRLSETERAATRATDRFMTPEYASPEQVRGEAVTTATDVYALGVVLYELLTGERMIRLEGKSPTECERAICETEPEKPSLLLPELAGDLDSMVMKALAKEPARRYGSVAQFSEDIARYLNGRPVEAQPSTWRYYAGKFVRRNKIAVSAAALVSVLLTAAVIATALAERRASAAQRKTQQNLERMLAAANTSLFGVHDSIADLPGSTKARGLLVRNVLDYLEPLAKQNSGNPGLLRELAEAYERLSDIQFRDGPGYLGDSAGALQSANQALHLREGLTDGAAVAADASRVATIERMTRNLAASEGHYERAIALYAELSRGNPADREMRSRLAQAYQDLAAAERLSGAASGAAQHVAEAVAIEKKLLEEKPGDERSRRALGQAYLTKCRIQKGQLGDWAGALQSCKTGFGMAEELERQDPKSRQYQTDLATACGELGNLYLGRDDAMALHWYERSFGLVARLAGTDPADARMRRSVAVHGANVALALTRLGRKTEAEAYFRKSLAIHTGLAQTDTGSTLAQDDAAFTGTALGALLVQEGRVMEALQLLEESIEIRDRLLTKDAGNVEWQYRLARTYSVLGQAKEKQADCAGAAMAFRKSEGMLQAIGGKMETGGELKTVREHLRNCSARLINLQ